MSLDVPDIWGTGSCLACNATEIISSEQLNIAISALFQTWLQPSKICRLCFVLINRVLFKFYEFVSKAKHNRQCLPFTSLHTWTIAFGLHTWMMADLVYTPGRWHPAYTPGQ